MATAVPPGCYDSSIPGSYEAFKRRQRARYWKGVLFGLVFCATIFGGNILGPLGVAIAAGGWGLGGALLASGKS